MDILIIAQYFPPDLGGSATRAYNVAKGLILNGCKVNVITAFPHYPDGYIHTKYKWKPIKVEWFEGIRVIRTFIFPLKSKGLARRIILFGTFVLASLFAFPLVNKFDVVWAANPDVTSMIPAIIYGKLAGKSIASNVDDLSLEDLFDLKMIRKESIISKIFKFITKFAYINAKLITPISPGYIKTILGYGIDKNKIHVVKGGVNLNIFKPIPAIQNTSTFIVLYTGAFSIAYNFDQVLKAAEILKKEDSEIKIIIQGKGELVNNIKSKIKMLNLTNVNLIDKVISRGEVAELLNQADVLILPLGDYGKPHLGISAKLYEYQAVEKPIICCSSGTPGHYVSDTKSGIVVKPGDYESLAKSILYLRENLNIAKQFGENGRKYVENNVSIDKVGLQMKNLFKDLINK